MEKRTKLRTTMLIAVLFLSNIGIMGINFYAIVMTQLYANYEEWAVNLMMSLPSLIGLFACLAAGKISDKMDKKTLFLAGLILFTISGTVFGGLGYGSSILMIIAASLNGGICYGMISVGALGIISDCFEDEDERSKVMGWYNGAMAAVGAVLSLAFGGLATIDWKLASAANWFTVVVIILAFIYVPACPPHKTGADNQKESQRVKGEKGWAKRLIPILLAFFAVSFAYMSVNTYIDLYITGNQLGDSALTGLCTTVQTIFSFLLCSSFGFLYQKFKNKITAPAYILLAVSILLQYCFPSKAMALIGCAMGGAAWGTVYTYWFFRATVVVPEKMVGSANGLVTTVNSLSYVPIPYVITGAMAMLGTENITTLFPGYAGVILVVAVIAFFYNAKISKAETV